jgi:hypothetical protein
MIRMSLVVTALVLWSIVLWTCPSGALAGGELTGFPENASTFALLRDGQPYLELTLAGWGPKWSWMGMSGELTQVEKKTVAKLDPTVRPSGARLSLVGKLHKTGPRRLLMDIDLRTDKDTDLTYVITGLSTKSKRFEGGKVAVSLAGGKTKELDLPLGRGGLGDQVESFALIDADGARTTFRLTPAMDVSSDGEIRIILARGLEKDEPVKATIAVDTPGELTWYQGAEQVPQAEGFDEWYAFRPDNDHDKPNEIGLNDWLDAPAGKAGRVTDTDGVLTVGGKPIKLWGLNICYASCAPEKDLARKRAAMYAKFGVNAVRLHKYADGPGWAGIQADESFLAFDAEALDRMDYFVAELKKRGIYTKLSSTFGVKLGPGDKARVPYMDEFGKLRRRGGGRVKTGHGSVYLSRELQEMQIAQVVKLLEHRNPYTGKTYAEDPAIAIVELFNEDSALFYGTMGRLQKIPTLRKRAGSAFFQWLKKRYKTKDALLKAWAPAGLNCFANEGFTGESWEDGHIVPAGNPWFYDPTQLAGSQEPKKARLLDTMRFLYEIQNDFNDRYVAAIRKAGYEGEILASNWHAGRAFSHYYNLHSDARIGMIDRHNYFGGGSRTKINNVSMCRLPGSGTLSSGMEQVDGRAFSLSEWIHVTPNEWGVEGPAIIGAYGMGLQGWDVSFLFQNRDTGEFTERIGRDKWDVTAPQVIGVFPAVSRQVHRGDVKASDVVAPRYVHVPSLHEGKLGFEDITTQQWDVKTFDSDKVPARTLAVARCVVEFTDRYHPTPEFDLDKYVRDGVYRSTTGQLAWTEGDERLDGHIAIDTPGTQAVVGFAAGQACRLGDTTITPASRYAAVYVTARDPGADLRTGDEAVIVAIARARNTNMKIVEDSRILAKGKPPVVLEPVRATIALPRPAKVHVLDHDGRKTGRTIDASDKTLDLDTARDKTPYFLVEFTD